MSIEIDHYNIVKKEIQGKASLLVVSKRHSEEDIKAYYALGQRAFGENRVQELLTKVHLYDDIKWHFIGHLQRNKVKQVLPYISMLESLDSLELAQELEKQCCQLNKQLPVLVEFHLAENDTRKTGLAKEEAIDFLTACKSFPHLKVEGIMVMGPHTDDTNEIEQVFSEAHELFLRLQNVFGKDTVHTLSMGMSDDYKLALKHGSTQVRIGTYLFHKEDFT